MIKIKEYKIRKSGVRGMVITLPQVWIQDNNLEPGDEIEIFRTDDEKLVLNKKVKK